MKTKILLALFLAGVAALVVAQRPVACTAADAGEHVGEIATITGTVNSVHQAEKGNIFVNIGARYTN